MTQENKNLLCNVWDAVTAVATVAAGGCLMAGCLGIYRSGKGFSREAVAAAFSPIAIPVYVCLGAVIGGLLLHSIFSSEKKNRPQRQTRMILKRMQKKKDALACGPTLRGDILRQRKLRLLHNAVTAGLAAIGSIVFLLLALQPGAFDAAEINDSVIWTMKVLLPCVMIPCSYGIFAGYYNRRSMEKEIALLKLAPNRIDEQSGSPAPAFSWLLTLRLAVTAIAAILIVYGLFTGGIADVLTKAINICTECVGLG